MFSVFLYQAMRAEVFLFFISLDCHLFRFCMCFRYRYQLSPSPRSWNYLPKAAAKIFADKSARLLGTYIARQTLLGIHWTAYTGQERLSFDISETKPKMILTGDQEQLVRTKLLDEVCYAEHHLVPHLYSQLRRDVIIPNKPAFDDEIAGVGIERELGIVNPPIDKISLKAKKNKFPFVAGKGPRDFRRYWGGR